MRARYFILGSMLLVPSLAGCATAPRASTNDTPSYAVRESALDSMLRTNCETDRIQRTDLIGVPVAMVVRPDGTVEPGSVRVTKPLRTRNRTASELRRAEETVRSDVVTRASACTFSHPTRDGQPVHARVQRQIAVAL